MNEYSYSSLFEDKDMGEVNKKIQPHLLHLLNKVEKELKSGHYLTTAKFPHDIQFVEETIIKYAWACIYKTLDDEPESVIKILGTPQSAKVSDAANGIKYLVENQFVAKYSMYISAICLWTWLIICKMEYSEDKFLKLVIIELEKRLETDIVISNYYSVISQEYAPLYQNQEKEKLLKRITTSKAKSGDTNNEFLTKQNNDLAKKIEELKKENQELKAEQFNFKNTLSHFIIEKNKLDDILKELRSADKNGTIMIRWRELEGKGIVKEIPDSQRSDFVYILMGALHLEKTHRTYVEQYKNNKH